MIDLIHNFISAHPWILLVVIPHLTILLAVAYLILLERKIASWTQDRIGPNRVGPYGLLQPIADGLKFIFKEDYMPAGVDKILFTIAPGLMILSIIVSIAVLPWGGIHQVTKTFTVPQNSDPKVMKVEADRLAAAAIPINGSIVAVKAGELLTVPDPKDPSKTITTDKNPFRTETAGVVENGIENSGPSAPFLSPTATPSRAPTSTSARSLSSGCWVWRSMASCSAGGRATTSIRSWARFERQPRWSATKFRSAFAC